MTAPRSLQRRGNGATPTVSLKETDAKSFKDFASGGLRP
jgi:hypothetical protein